MDNPNTTAVHVDAWFHPKLRGLFEPHRYKVLYGGRGGLKTWGVARALLVLASQKPLRILCAREFQKSIKESVHQVLESQIELMGLQGFFEIQRDTIKGRPGTSAAGSEFFFIGLHLNSQAIKSYEGVDICWVEEAANVSGASWDYLTPTLRKPDGGPFGRGSEIWITFNPELESDATYKRFVLTPPPDAYVQKTSWLDNPYISEHLLAEILSDKENNFDKYLHVWEGFCKQVLEGAVYADELRDATREKRITKVPWERAYSVIAAFDLGYSDHTSIWFAQKAGFEWHIIDFYENRLKKLDHYLEVLQRKGYYYEALWLPHDARAKQLGSKMTIEEQVRLKFPNAVRIVKRASIKDKINAARTIFPNCYFDEERCADGLQHLRHYKFDVDETTKQFSQKPLHDEHSDAGSAFEYFALASASPVRSKEGMGERLAKALKLNRRQGPLDVGSDQFSWMK